MFWMVQSNSNHTSRKRSAPRRSPRPAAARRASGRLSGTPPRARGRPDPPKSHCAEARSARSRTRLRAQPCQEENQGFRERRGRRERKLAGGKRFTAPFLPLSSSGVCVVQCGRVEGVSTPVTRDEACTRKCTDPPRDAHYVEHKTRYDTRCSLIIHHAYSKDRYYCSSVELQDKVVHQ